MSSGHAPRDSYSPGKYQTEYFKHLLLRIPVYPASWITRFACPQATACVFERLAIQREIAQVTDELSQRLFEAIGQLTGKTRSFALDLKRHLAKTTDSPLPEKLKEALPSLSQEIQNAYFRREELKQAERAASTRYQERFQDELRAARASLLQLLADVRLKNGILLSSTGLYEAMEDYIDHPPAASENATKSHRIFERTVLDHLFRGAMNTTPRGLMAGVSVATWDSAEATEPFKPASSSSEKERAIRPRFLVNPVVLRALAKRITASEQLAQFIVPRPTWTMHRASADSEEISFLIPPLNGDEAVVALENNEVLDALIELSSQRRLTARELLEQVCARCSDDYSMEEINHYYRQLCDRGLIIGTLEIPHERDDGLAYLVEWLEGVAAKIAPSEKQTRTECDAWLTDLRSLQAAIGALSGAMDDHERCKAALHQVRELVLRLTGVSKEDRHRRSFQTPLVIDCELRAGIDKFPRSLQTQIEAGVEATLATTRFSMRAVTPEYVLDAFKALGVKEEDWQNDRLPLWRIARLNVPGNPRQTHLPEIKKLIRRAPNRADGRRLGELLRPQFDSMKVGQPDGPKQIDMKPLLDRLAGEPQSFPLPERYEGLASFYVARRPESGDTHLVFHTTYSGATSGMARFLPLLNRAAFDEESEYHLKWTGESFFPDAMPVDLPILTFTRVDGVTLVPRYFKHCIECTGARSERDAANILRLDDLYIQRGDKLRLLWKRDDQKWVEILPLQPNTINQGMMSILAHFLGTLYWASESRQAALAALPSFLLELEYSPRLTIGSVVLARETWHERVENLLPQVSAVQAETFFQWNAWRSRKGMPRFVFVWQHKNRKFAVDFECPFSIDALNAAVNSLSAQSPDAAKLTMKFVEMSPTPQETWQVLDEETETHACEVFLGFRRTAQT